MRNYDGFKVVSEALKVADKQKEEPKKQSVAGGAVKGLLGGTLAGVAAGQLGKEAGYGLGKLGATKVGPKIQKAFSRRGLAALAGVGGAVGLSAARALRNRRIQKMKDEKAGLKK